MALHFANFGLPEQALGWFPPGLGLGWVTEDESSEFSHSYNTNCSYMLYRLAIASYLGVSWISQGKLARCSYVAALRDDLKSTLYVWYEEKVARYSREIN